MWDGDSLLKFGCVFIWYRECVPLGRFAVIDDLIGFDFHFFAYFFLIGTFLKVYARCFRWVCVLGVVVLGSVVRYVSLYVVN